VARFIFVKSLNVEIGNGCSCYDSMKAVTSARCSIGRCSLVSFLNTGEDQFHSSCLIAPWINPVCWHRMCLQLAWHQEGHPAGKSSTVAISKSFFKHIRGLLWLSCLENDRLIYWSLLDRYLSVDLTAHFNPHCTSPNLTVSCLTRIKSTMGFFLLTLGARFTKYLTTVLLSYDNAKVPLNLQ